MQDMLNANAGQAPIGKQQAALLFLQEAAIQYLNS